VGRAAVNHPCAALHTVDAQLYGRPRLGLGLGLGLALTPTKTLTRTLTPAPTLTLTLTTSAAPSRGAVLAEYIAYVEAEERGPLRGRGGTSGADSPIALT